MDKISFANGTPGNLMRKVSAMAWARHDHRFGANIRYLDSVYICSRECESLWVLAVRRAESVAEDQGEGR